MEESRTKNTIKNVKTSLVVQIISKLIRFIVRTVFIKVLSTEYLGLNGLFANILTILSFTELGIGTAITFNLYKPIANKDKEKIKSLMKLYKKCYTIVGIAIVALGLCFIPFLDFIIKEVPNIKEKISFIYILFLLNTSVTYFFSYKETIIVAHQQQNVVNKIKMYCEIGKGILEILFLLLTKNYIVYLIIQILWTIIKNISVANKANKMFPYLKEKNVSNLSKEEKGNILLNVKSLFISKLASVLNDVSDNVLISILVGINMVGIYSNYSLILTTIREILILVLNNAVIASVGNLNVIGTKERKEEVLHELTFINFWIYGLCAVMFFILLNPFIEIWIGTQYLLNIEIPLVLAIGFFLCGLRRPCDTYNTVLGLFKQNQYISYIGLIAKIFFSILIYSSYGIIGIFIANIISELISYSWMKPYMIYKYEINTTPINYFKKYTVYVIVFIMELIISVIIIKFIQFNGIIGIIIKTIISFSIINTINFLCFHNTKEFREVKDKIIITVLKGK